MKTENKKILKWIILTFLWTGTLYQMAEVDRSHGLDFQESEITADLVGVIIATAIVWALFKWRKA